MPSSQRTILIVAEHVEAYDRYARALADDTVGAIRSVRGANGREALDRCASMQPEVVIVPACLPDIEISAFLAELHAACGSCAVLLIATAADERRIGIASCSSLVDVLAPRHVTAASLRRAVARLIERNALRQQIADATTRIARQRDEIETVRRETAQVMDGMADAFYVLDDQWRFTMLNTAAERLFQQPRSALLGARLWDRLPAGSHSDVRETYERWFNQAVADRQRREFETYLPWMPGWYQVRVHPSDDGVAVYTQDITYQKSIRASLQGSDQQIRRLVDANIVGIMTADLDGLIVEANEMFLNLIGYTRPQLEANEILWTALTPPEFQERDRQALDELRRTGIAHPYEKAYIHRDGHLVPVVNGAAVLNADPQTVIAFILDITERKQAENALRRREREFATLVANLPDVVSRFDRDFRYLFVSPAVERATGLPSDAFIGRTNREVGMSEHLCERWDAQLRQVFATGDEVTFDFATDTPIGPRHYESCLIPERNDAGEIETVLCITRDITALKRSEQSLRFLDQVSTTLGTSLVYQELIQRTAELAVPTLADHCAVYVLMPDGSSRRTAACGTLPEQARNWIADVFPSGTTNGFGPTNVMRTGRSEVFCDTTPAPAVPSAAPSSACPLMLHGMGIRSMMTVPLKTGSRVLGTLMLTISASSRRFDANDLALAEELAQRAAVALDHAGLYQTAHEAVRERDAFLSVAAHEVKNPLSMVLGHAQLMERRERRLPRPSEDNLYDLGMIIEQTRRATTLLSDMQNASLFESGMLRLASDAVDLHAVVQRVITSVRPALRGFNLVMPPLRESVLVSGDAARLEQVFNNLIGNAIKYSPAGGTITVTFSTYERFARVAISDTGIGIPQAAIPNLFKRFFRARSDDTRDIPGSGLGLYVVNEIVSRHGGRIGVTSVEGKGSTFTVDLPLVVGGSTPRPPVPDVRVG